MTAAIFGLLGVIVGGVLNALVAAWQQRRLQQSDRRAAARLVRSELVYFLAAGETVAEGRADQLPKLRSATTELWQSNRSVLAQTLGRKEWARVARAYAYVEQLLSLMVFELDGRLEGWRVNEATRVAIPMVDQIEKAVESLRDDTSDTEPTIDADSQDRPDRYDEGVSPSDQVA